MEEKDKKNNEFRPILKEFKERINTDFRRLEDMEYLCAKLGSYIASTMEAKFTVPSEKHFNDHTKNIPDMLQWVNKQKELEKIEEETKLILKRESMKYILLGTLGVISSMLVLGFFVFLKLNIKAD